MKTTNYEMHNKASQKRMSEALRLLRIVKAGKADKNVYIMLAQCLSITTHEGKMKGINSISTSCLDNKYCLARMKAGDSVCAHCFAESLLSYRQGLGDNCIINGKVLRSVVIPVEAFKQAKNFEPLLNAQIFRIESFGDVENVTQAINYIHLIRAYPLVFFGVWSKNYKVWVKAFEQEGKPDNMSFVISSVKMNVPEKVKEYADHVFTVYDLEHAKQEKHINCPLSCIHCQKCYRKDLKDSPVYINEILKAESKKYWEYIKNNA
jgi:hypothetical protein